MADTVYAFSSRGIDGQEVALERFHGRVLLIVNVASECGYTPQYAGLQALYQKYRDRGLEVLGFPCNQFGKQEPGTEAEIARFCQTKYGVRFPLFAKIEVNGAREHPLYRFLKAAAGDPRPIEWNFEKFLVDRSGQTVTRFEPAVTHEALAAPIEKLL